MAYSEHFIKEVIDNMPSSINSFFEDNKETLDLAEYSFPEYVSEVLEARYKNYTRREMLAPAGHKVVATKREKRNFIMERYNKLLGLKISNPKHPLHYLELLPSQKKKEIFGDMGYEAILQSHKQECEAWYNDSSSLLIDFIGINYLSNTIKNNSLRVDVEMCFWRYVDGQYNGNLSSGSVKRILANVPLIPPKSFKEKLEESPDEPDMLSLVSAENKDVVFKIRASDLFLNDLRSLDPSAIMILSVIINNITDMDEFSKTRRVKLPLARITDEVVDYGASQRIIEKVEAMITYMSLVLVPYFNEETMVEPTRIHIFDSYTPPFKVGNAKWVEVRFSEELAAEIVGEKVLSVSKKQYKKLTDPNAKIICHSMKSEQIAKNKETSDRIGTYDFSFFVGKIRFSTGNRKNNMQLLKNAFEDFKVNGVIVEDYELIDNLFYVTFLPYDEEEYF